MRNTLHYLGWEHLHTRLCFSTIFLPPFTPRQREAVDVLGGLNLAGTPSTKAGTGLGTDGGAQSREAKVYYCHTKSGSEPHS